MLACAHKCSQFVLALFFFTQQCILSTPLEVVNNK
jgi:hypothetical protein